MAIPRGVMGKRRRQLASSLVFASALMAVIALIPLPVPLRAQSQVPTTGIDPQLLANARAGDAGAQVKLGGLYYVGHGVQQDYAQAAAWYRKAADQGLAEAQFMLGVYYDSGGRSVPQDYAQAATWYRKAADQGFAVAQYSLGILYSRGQGVPQSFAESYFWLNLAAAGSNGADQE